MENETVNLLWTGGWDSTFRLLDLLLVKQKKVQTFYIIDPDRRSAGIELRTMATIKQYLLEKHPQISRSLQPTRYKHLNDICKNKQITESYDRLRKRYLIG